MMVDKPAGSESPGVWVDVRAGAEQLSAAVGAAHVTEGLQVTVSAGQPTNVGGMVSAKQGSVIGLASKIEMSSTAMSPLKDIPVTLCHRNCASPENGDKSITTLSHGALPEVWCWPICDQSVVQLWPPSDVISR